MAYVIVAAVFFAAGAYGWPKITNLVTTKATAVEAEVKAKIDEKL